jgi:hypothetical protein
LPNPLILMRREKSGANMIRNFAVRYLAWILAAWMGSWCMALSTVGVAAERPPAGMMSVEYRAAVLATSVMPGRGTGDNEIILDEQDAVDSDAATLAGLEDSQPFTFAFDVPGQRDAVYERARAWRNVSIMEPRFLRYSRLLN